MEMTVLTTVEHVTQSVVTATDQNHVIVITVLNMHIGTLLISVNVTLIGAVSTVKHSPGLVIQSATNQLAVQVSQLNTVNYVGSTLIVTRMEYVLAMQTGVVWTVASTWVSAIHYVLVVMDQMTVTVTNA